MEEGRRESERAALGGICLQEEGRAVGAGGVERVESEACSHPSSWIIIHIRKIVQIVSASHVSVNCTDLCGPHAV